MPIHISGPTSVAHQMFFIVTALYFIVTLKFTLTPPWTIMLKCLPILCLIFRVGQQIKPSNFSWRGRPEKILLGLTYSCMGDAFLVFDDFYFFITGLLCFSGAHIVYISAFGFDKLRLGLGAAFGFFAIYIMPNFLPEPEEPLCLPLLAYGFILSLMGWRAVAQMEFKNPVDENRALVAMGGVLFVVSDMCLAYREFVTGCKCTISHITVMATYYFAQYGISHFASVEG